MHCYTVQLHYYIIPDSVILWDSRGICSKGAIVHVAVFPLKTSSVIVSTSLFRSFGLLRKFV